MQFIFEAAVDAAHQAHGVVDALRNQEPTGVEEEVHAHRRVTVDLSYSITTKEGDKVVGIKQYTSSHLNRAVERWIVDHLDEAMDHALLELDTRAEQALVAAEGQLRERLAEIETIKSKSAQPA